MKLSMEMIDEIVVVTLPGERLDAGNVNEFKAGIRPILEAHSRLIFDLSETRFVDSAGLGSLLSCLRYNTFHPRSIRICGMQSSVQTLFELVRMHKVFGIYANREEALAAFASPSGRTQ